MKFRFCGDLDCPDWVLAEISTLSKMSSIRMKILVVQILSYCLKGTFNYEKVLKIAGDSTDGVSDIKGAVAALHFMLTNAAKYDLDDQSLVQEIQQLGLPKENTEAIARQYREAREYLRARFAQESFRVSKLCAVDWRVDQVISSSEQLKTTNAASKAADSVMGAADAVTVRKETVFANIGPTVHVKLQVDTNPELNTIDEDGMAISHPCCVKDLAFEITPNKLNVLIHELSQAQKLLQNMDSGV